MPAITKPPSGLRLKPCASTMPDPSSSGRPSLFMRATPPRASETQMPSWSVQTHSGRSSPTPNVPKSAAVNLKSESFMRRLRDLWTGCDLGRQRGRGEADIPVPGQIAARMTPADDILLQRIHAGHEMLRRMRHLFECHVGGRAVIGRPVRLVCSLRVARARKARPIIDHRIRELSLL